MIPSNKDGLDVRIRDALSAWKKLDETAVKVLEMLSILGPRNLTPIAKHLQLPESTLRYRVRRMISNSYLFLHLNPYHTNMGLKKAVTFVDAASGHEEDLIDFLRVNDFWVFLCRIHGSYEGCAGVWTIPVESVERFESFLSKLQDSGVARNFEVIWSTCFQGIPVSTRWFSFEGGTWVFNWEEWIKEVETIKGTLPHTLLEPDDWPIKVDYEDLLIIKELEIDGRASITDISKKVGIPLERAKYHFREHVLKRGLVEGYQVEIYGVPFILREACFFKFEFDNYEKMTKFALSLSDKPFATFVGKVLGEDALISHIKLPRWEFTNFIGTLSTLVRRGFLKQYHYTVQDMYQTWRETIPYEHFENGRWNYDNEKHLQKIEELLKNKAFTV